MLSGMLSSTMPKSDSEQWTILRAGFSGCSGAFGPSTAEAGFTGLTPVETGEGLSQVIHAQRENWMAMGRLKQG